jgi:putative spermidine/putrescine transport system permease protein
MAQAEATGNLMTTTDGVPLKVSLRRAMRRNRIKATLLAAPLLLFILITFIIPIVNMSWRSVDNPELRAAIPQTLDLLDAWDGEGLPSEDVYATLAQEMAAGKKNRTIGKVGARLNREVSGTRSLINKTVRKVAKLKEGPYKEVFLKADKRWGETDLWRHIKRIGRPYTSAFYAAAVDMAYDAEGELYRLPEDEQIYITLSIRTMWISFLVTFFCILLGYPIAFLMATLPTKSSNLLMIMVLLPFWTSLLVRTTTWIVILGTNGVLNDLLVWIGIISDEGRLRMMFNQTGVIIAMTHILLPFMVLPLFSVMKTIPPSYMRAARSLGANPLVAFVRVYLPQTLPGIGAGSILVFIVAIGYYITPALVGGQSGQMISNLIAYHMQSSLNWGLAAALGVLLLIGVLALYWLYNKIVGIDNMKLG